MPIGGRPETLSQAARLKPEVEALRWASAVLRDECARNRHIAARACEDARRIRGELFRVRLPRGPTCARVARRLVDTHLVSPNAEELADARTVVSELVSNAFVHGDGAIELRVALRRGRVRIEVRDEGQDASIRLHSGDIPHGLHLVDALALVWGHAREAPMCGPNCPPTDRAFAERRTGQWETQRRRHHLLTPSLTQG